LVHSLPVLRAPQQAPNFIGPVAAGARTGHALLYEPETGRDDPIVALDSAAE
jgi:hypothetical protein